MNEKTEEIGVFTKYSELITSHKDILLVSPIVLYVIGFLIVNFHLGTLGITNFDLLRARYILVGAMFVLFVAVLTGMFKALWRRISNVELSPWRRLENSLWYTFSAVGIVMILGIVITYLSGELSSPAVWISGTSESAIDIAIGSSDENLRLLVYPSALIVIIMIGIVVYAFLRPATRKDGSVWSRRDVLRTTPLIGVMTILGIIMMIVAVVTIRFIGALSSVETVGSPKPSLANITPLLWLILVFYLFGSVLILALGLIAVISSSTGTRNDAAPKEEQKGMNVPGSIFPLEGLIIILVALFLAYVGAAYPGIPQQVGGGAVIPVRIALRAQQDELFFRNCENEVYLVDRTPRTIILVVFDETGDVLRTVEITNTDIVGIEYYPKC